ncbi:unannotated protein [freshwater metagenome]|uniref:Unannotated protein n=1 Tax=freshwater metagenome TaxID=449393 RepID=A0A6J7IL95_9ZZZZ|nr:hypothetical protein [Actinomycetota bacterium]
MGSSYSDVPYPEKNYPGPKIDARDPEAARRTTGEMGWVIMSHLISGILLYTFLGWLLSLWLGNAPLLMAVGAVLGIVLATYMIYRRLQATPKSTPARRNRK